MTQPGWGMACRRSRYQEPPGPDHRRGLCRRFDAETILALQEAINAARLRVWAAQPDFFFAGPAIIDADASIVPTEAETNAGMDISYDGIWGTRPSWPTPKNRCIWACSGPTGPATRSGTSTGLSPCAARPTSHRSAYAATPTMHSQRKPHRRRGRALRLRLRRPGQPHRAGRGADEAMQQSLGVHPFHANCGSFQRRSRQLPWDQSVATRQSPAVGLVSLLIDHHGHHAQETASRISHHAGSQRRT
jgi:hypothetical protein